MKLGQCTTKLGCPKSILVTLTFLEPRWGYMNRSCHVAICRMNSSSVAVLFDSIRKHHVYSSFDSFCFYLRIYLLPLSFKICNLCTWMRALAIFNVFSLNSIIYRWLQFLIPWCSSWSGFRGWRTSNKGLWRFKCFELGDLRFFNSRAKY